MTHFFPTGTRIFRFRFFFAWLWSNIFCLCCPNFKYTGIKFILLFHNILLLSFSSLGLGLVASGSVLVLQPESESVSRSGVSNSSRPYGTVARLAPLSMEFFRQEYWSQLSCASPGDLPKPGIKPAPPALQADSLLSKPPGKPN